MNGRDEKAAARNVLMIVVDDLRPELNCFGKNKLHTPNIDRLAARSMLYERAYCQFPQCMPSRASLMSGIRPRERCTWSNHLCRKGEPTLPGWLRAHGLGTISAGKVYHEPLDDAFSWSELHMDTFRPRRNGGMSQEFHDYQRPENQRRARNWSMFTRPAVNCSGWKTLPISRDGHCRGPESRAKAAKRHSLFPTAPGRL